MHQSLLCFGQKPPHNKKPPFGPWDRDKAFGFWAFIKQPCRVNGCKLGRWSWVFFHVSLWHANKYCSTVSAFNIAHANFNWSMYIGHILEIRAQGNYKVSNSILWKSLLESPAGRGRATPQCWRLPNRRNDAAPGISTPRKLSGRRYLRQIRWSPPNQKPFFRWLFVGRFGPTPAWARRSWRQPYRRWTVKNKIVGEWIKCYMTFFQQHPETPKWSMACQ